MRPLPVERGRRAALTSVIGHCAFMALLTLVGVRTQIPSIESPLIIGELFTVSLDPADIPSTPAPVPPAEPVDEATPLQPASEPAPAPEPVAEPIPAPAPQIAEPKPEPVAPRERTVEPPAEPAPTERLAELPAPAVESAAEVPEAPLPEVAEAAPAATAQTVAAERPSRAFASPEERVVRRRLSSWTGSFEVGETDKTLEWRDNGQAYKAVLKHVPAADAMGMEQLLVELTTERDGEQLMTELRMSRIAFSNFGQFVNVWDPEVGLHDDVIEGRLHSNTDLILSHRGRATPVFTGKVTIAGGDLVASDDGLLTTGPPPRINRRKLFPAGIETHTRRIDLPKRAAAVETIAGPDNSQRFANDAALTFHDDGSVSWRELDDRAADGRRALGGEPFYLLAEDDVDLEVQGIVNGKVLVYTPARIIITGDLRYAVDPRTPHADDYLGLVAERSVEIAEPDVTGAGDLEVFAAIYAKQRFAVREYRSQRSGTLIIHGSLTSGTLTATEPRFATKIEFDNRLTTMRAPSFPLSDRYELDTVSDVWRVVDTPAKRGSP